MTEPQPESPEVVIARLQEQVMRQADIIVEQSETIDRQGARLLMLTIEQDGTLDTDRLKDTIRTLWESRRLWQERVRQSEEDLTESEFQRSVTERQLVLQNECTPDLVRRTEHLARRVKAMQIRIERLGRDAHALVGYENAVNAILDLADEWESKAGPGSSWENAYGKQVVSVEFAVQVLRETIAEHHPRNADDPDQPSQQDDLAAAWQQGYWAAVNRGPHATRNPYDPARVGPRNNKEAR